MKALVTGATGFIGRRLVAALERAVVLVRDPERAAKELGGVEVFGWDAGAGMPPAEAFRGVDAVFNLAGEPVAERRWNEERKRRILASREIGTRDLVAAMARLETRPEVLVSASAVGFYGDRGDEELDESASGGAEEDFLCRVCRAWEAEAERAAALGVRVVRARIGVVLGSGGGALSKMLTPFKLGLGGRLGTGKQWKPRVHHDDEVGMLMWAARTHSISGPVNVVSPNPVTNREFTRALARSLWRPALFPVPRLALRLMVGEMAGMLLASQRVVPGVATRGGYIFLHPEVVETIAFILGGCE